VATNTNWNGTDPIVLSQKLTNEGGLTDSFFVELATQPLSNVTVDLAVSDSTEALISSGGSGDQSNLTLTFTNATWNVGQQVTITGQPDALVDGNVAYTVTIVTTDETDDKYDNLSTGPVNGVNEDGNTPGQLRFTQTNQSGDEGDAITLTVERINGTSGAVTVDYAITPNTATGADYNDTTAPGGTLSFADGVTSRDISITLVDDPLWEPAAEDFSVALSNATGGATILSPSSQTVSINPSDPVVISISAPSPNPAPEGDTGDPQVAVTFTVDYTGGTLSSPMTISWMTVNGTATGGSDFDAVGSTNFDLPVNGDPVDLVVNVNGDDTPEGDETFSVQLSESLDLVSLAGGGASVATIQDDDASDDGTFSITNISPNPVMESAGSVTVTVSRIGNTVNSAATINFATSDGTAVEPGDYTNTSGSLVWALDDTDAFKTFNVPINDNAAGEPAETFTVTITPDASEVIGIDSGVVTIIGDPTVTLSPASYNVGEADGSVTVFVTRANVDDGAVAVDYTTTDGTAIAGEDYTTTSGTLNWGAAELGPKPINIPIIADADAIGPETFTVDLSGCSNCAIIVAQATVTISEGAPPLTTPGTLAFDPIAILVSEATGDASLFVTRTGGTDGTVTIDYETQAGSASSPADFASVSGTLSWADGVGGNRLISVPVVDDSTVEPTETFTVRFIPASETGTDGLPTVGASPATVSIQDNDSSSAGELSILSTNVSEGDGMINVTVSRNGGSDGAASVDFATMDGTALAGSDYTANNGTLNWADGDAASKNIQIQILDDAVIESQEEFTVNLSNETGATIADGSATVVIYDDDGGGNFSISDVTVFEIDQQATVTITRSNDNNTAAFVAWETRDGTAQDENGDNDYKSDSSAISGELIWLDGDTSNTRTITIAIVPDDKVEGDEWFTVTLVSVQGADSVISKADGVVTIKDPIPIPTLSQWAMGLMVLLLLGIGAYSLPLRRKQAVSRK
ncbi:MAG: IPTL-CTERM sorting domain-containing protein, partial [Lysobacterales bacterium]